MQINHIHFQNEPIGKSEYSFKNSTVRSDLTNRSKTGEVSALTAEFSNLLQRVRETAEIREERLVAVHDRLQSGFYLRPTAALETASAILNTPE